MPAPSTCEDAVRKPRHGSPLLGALRTSLDCGEARKCEGVAKGFPPWLKRLLVSDRAPFSFNSFSSGAWSSLRDSACRTPLRTPWCCSWGTPCLTPPVLLGVGLAVRNRLPNVSQNLGEVRGVLGSAGEGGSEPNWAARQAKWRKGVDHRMVSEACLVGFESCLPDHLIARHLNRI